MMDTKRQPQGSSARRRRSSASTNLGSPGSLSFKLSTSMSFRTILNRLTPSSPGTNSDANYFHHHHHHHHHHHSASDYAPILPTQNSPLPSKQRGSVSPLHVGRWCWLPTRICSTLVALLPRRAPRVVFAFVIALLLWLSLLSRRSPHEDWSTYPAESWALMDGAPPSYNQYLEYEKHLPAHNPELPYPNGEHAKFIYFGNHQWGVGWGNVLQEMIYNAYFAYHVKRSFVFYNYTWNQDDPAFTKFNNHFIPSRVPLSAILSGPMVGGSMGPEDAEVPRAVSWDYFNEVCPQSERHIIDGKNVLEGLSDPTATQLLAKLAKVVKSTDARCIELPQDTSQVFNYILFGSTQALDIWPQIRKSPIFTKLGWSPLIHSAYDQNKEIFEVEPSSFFYSLYAPIWKRISTVFASNSLTPLVPPYPLLDDLLVIHVRRGDYKEHCWHFVKYKSRYNGYNSFDELPDHFTPPPGPQTDADGPEYMKHCFPSVMQIVDRVKDVKEKVKRLKRVYVMTNGDKEFLDELKAALKNAGKWDQITTSKDLALSWEQKPISQVLDMYVAQRAQAFIGNGFSSMTSNIVMFRMGNPSLSPNETFFW